MKSTAAVKAAETVESVRPKTRRTGVQGKAAAAAPPRGGGGAGGGGAATLGAGGGAPPLGW
jgi:hypothetical protein